MSKAKILFVCHDFPPFKYAGAQIYAMQLAQAINQSGVANVEIFHPVFRVDDLTQPYETLETTTFEDLVVHRLYKPTQNYDPANLRNELVAKAFDSFLTHHKYDLIHIHGLGQLSAVPIEIAKKHGIKTVMTVHDSWLICEEWHLVYPDQTVCSGPESIEKCANCFIKYYIQGNITPEFVQTIRSYKEIRHNYNLQMLNLLDVRVAQSSFLKNTYLKYGSKSISIIPLGFTLQKPLPKTNNKKIVFGYAGRITRIKGINHLVEAFKLLPEDKAELHIYGDSDDVFYLENTLSQAAEFENIKYFGTYSPEQLPSIFSTFDVSIIPSLMESFSRLIRESFMFKIPVIASDAGAIPEGIIDGQDGLIFKAGDVKSLYLCLKRVIDEPTLLQYLTSNIKRVRSLEYDLIDYLRLYDLRSIKRNKPQRIKERVLLYYFKNVHIPILQPIKDKLLEMQDQVELAIGYMHYAPDIRAGFTPEELQVIESYNIPMFARPQDFNPDITVIADSVYPWVQNCGKLIHIGHGILSKGQYYTDTETARREEQADIVCVPGEYHANVMKSIITKPVIATGMAKLDSLYNGTYQRDKILNQMGLPLDYKYILFSPTFNDELSAIPFVMNRINDVIPDNKTMLLIKLHGSTKHEYKEMYKELAKGDNRVLYIEDLDLAPYISLADIMITDVSSAMFEFASLDKPVILFNNPNWHKYPNYNPDDIEYKFRDIGVQTSSLSDIKQAIEDAFSTKPPLQESRLEICRQFINNIDKADATEKICEIIINETKNQARQRA